MIQNYQKKKTNQFVFKVILLEEEYNFQNILKNIFLKNKIIYQLRTVHNLEAFTSQLKKINQPDLIISNIKYASGDRRPSLISLAKKIVPETPILIITDSIGKNGNKELMVNGVIDIIEKKNEFKLTGIINLITSKKQSLTPPKKEFVRSTNNFNNHSEFFTNNVDPILIADPASGDLLEINRAASNLLGFTFDEVKSINIEDIMDYPDINKELASRPAINCIVKLKSNEKKTADVFLSSFTYKKRLIDAYTLRNVQDCKLCSNENYAYVNQREEFNFCNAYLNDAVFIHQIDDQLPGKFIEVNDTACKRLGYNKEELLEFTPLNIDWYSDPEKSKERLVLLHKNKEHIFETVHVTKEGKLIPVEICSRMIKFNGKDVIISSAKDLSEKKNYENRLIESEKKYKSLFKVNPVPLFIINLEDFTIIDVNDAVENQYGYKRKELVNKIISDFISPSVLNDNDSDKNILDKLCKNGYCKHTKKDKTEIDVSIISQDLSIDGKKIRLLSSFDITQKMKAEKILSDSELKFRQLVEQASDGIFVITDKGEISIVNSNFCKMYGLAEEKIVNSNIKEILISPQFAKHYQELIKAKKEKSIFFEDKLLTKINHPIEVEFNMKKRYDGYIQGFIRDISKRKKAEKDLLLLENIIKASKEAVVISDPLGNIIYHNSSYKNLMGEINSINIFKNMEEGFPPDSIEYINNDVMNLLRKNREWSGTFDIYDTSKKRIPIWASISVIVDNEDKPQYVIGFLHDMSIKKSMDIELRRLSRAVEQSPASIVMTDLEGNIEYVNPKFCEITGYSAKEVYGQNPRILKSGKMSDDEYKAMWDTVLSGKDWRGEFLNKKKSGELYWEYASISAIKDANGKFTNILGVKEDITERKKTDEAMKTSLYEKETLLKEIHHRVKNNLQIVSSLLSLQTDFVVDDYSKELFNDSRNRIKSMGLIHERLYQSNSFSKIDFEDYLNELTTHLFRTYVTDPKYIKLELKIEKEYLSIEQAIPCGLIINELISNALKYSTNGKKKVTVILSFKKNSKGQYILVVSDNGVGIPETINLENSKTLGLQLVNDLTLQLDGSLELNRTKGTKFTIKF